MVQIKDNRVAVQVAGDNPFAIGQQIDLSYMVGFLEMLIGRYRVYKIKGNLFAPQSGHESPDRDSQGGWR